MVQFIEPVLDRHQSLLLRDTLDKSIPLDHPVRVYDFVMDQHDWREWEAMYTGRGRPPYPPQVMCKLLVYGYTVGIRSSRALEYACKNNIDFIWLMSGRAPDHDTIANFRREHHKKFKEVYRITVSACEAAGMVSSGKMALDGTRVEANNADGQTKTAADLEQMLEKLDARIKKILAEAEAVDRREDTLFGSEGTPFALPRELKDLQRRQATLRKAFEKVVAKAARAMEAEGASADAAAKKRVPVTDPDADVMKDKQNGFGPNYTPYVGVDVESGVVTSQGVSNSHRDADHLRSAIEEAEANTHKPVGQVQADSGYATAENITYCEGRQIDPCIAPVNTNLESKKNPRKIPPWPEAIPAQATDVSGSVVDGPSLPRTSQGKFDKSAFSYDASSDCYTCPLGHSMPARGTKKRRRAGRVTLRTVYRCSACATCPFRPVCTSDPKGRAVNRDEEEDIHERQAERMRDPLRQQDYKLRKQTVEPTIGTIKNVLGVRRFLLRGLEYVRGEWSLTVAAYNLKKLASRLASHDAVAVGGRVYG